MAATDFITEAQGDTIATDLATAIKGVKTLLNNNAADLSGLTDSAANVVAALNGVVAKIGDLTTLTTTEKATVVGSINDLQAQVTAIAASGGAAIDDVGTSSSTVWSSTKTDNEITAAVAGVIDGAPGAIDTLNELAAALGDDPNFAATITSALAARLRFDAAQTLTGPQQAQALTNLGIVRSTVDFAAQIATDLA